MSLDIGVLGCGAIGSRVAAAAADGTLPDARLAGVHTRTPDRARSLLEGVAADGAEVVGDPADLARRSDVVVEAASQAALEASAVEVLEAGADLVALSVGAFRDADLLRAVRSAAGANGARVAVPSGSIAGLDGVRAAAFEPLEEVSLTSYKAPGDLAAYADALDVDLEGIESEQVIFEGSAGEAAATFTSHMNIAVALTLAARVDPADVTVRLVAVPGEDVPYSVHRVRAEGAAGVVETEIRNVSTGGDPGTNHLVVNATLETLRGMADPVRVGT